MRTTGFYFQGRQAEKKFATLFPNHLRANTVEDRYEGWDFKVPGWGRVNVKGLSRNRRFDSNFQLDHVWVELKTVDGRAGWGLSDTVDAVAFETHDGFLLIKQEDLQDCVFDRLVFEPGTQPYHLHSRPSRQDLVTRVPIKDLKEYDHAIISTSN